MHNLKPLIGELFKKGCIFSGVDRRCLRQDVPFAINAVNFVGDQVHPIGIGFAVKNDMERIIMHVIPFPQHVSQVTSAVRAQDRFFTQGRIPPF